MSPGRADLPERVLVTGAGGFLGQAITRGLRDAGVRVLATDIVQRDHHTDIQPLDLCDPSAVRALLERERPQAVVHCAAFGQDAAGLLASAEREPSRAVRVNVVAFQDLLQACQEAGIRRVVWSSSTTVYGPPSCYPGREAVTENEPPAPTTAYGATKMLAERIGARAFESGTFEPIALRFPLVYGPGRWYGGAQAEWMRFVREAVGGHAGAYRFETAPADWIYIDDAVAATLAALTAERLERPAYNIAGSVTSPFEMAELIAEVTQAACRLEPLDRARELVLIDGAAFERDARYTPATSLRRGAELFVEHLRTQRAAEKA